MNPRDKKGREAGGVHENHYAGGTVHSCLRGAYIAAQQEDNTVTHVKEQSPSSDRAEPDLSTLKSSRQVIVRNAEMQWQEN